MSNHDLKNWRPPPRPERGTLEGRHVTIVPLATAHAPALYELIKDPSEHFMWDYMSVGPFETFEDFKAQMKLWQDSNDPLFFTIFRKGDQHPVGAYSLLRIKPEHGTIEVGFIWFTKALRKTVGATEAIYLLSHYAMTTLGYRRYEWKCNALNEASRRAALRLGFTFEGVFRQHMVLKGKNRDSAWFSILDHEWPAIDAAFQAWLDPDNFDENGGQKISLRDLISKTKS